MMQKGGPEETAGELYPTEEWAPVATGAVKS
jgi:hypothetical protein